MFQEKTVYSCIALKVPFYTTASMHGHDLFMNYGKITSFILLLIKNDRKCWRLLHIGKDTIGITL